MNSPIDASELGRVRAAWQSGERALAAALADDLAERSGVGDAGALHLAGAVALESGLAALALQRFDAALALAGDGAESGLWNDRARALLALDRLEEAAQDLQRAIERDPTLPAPLLNLAMVRAAQHDRPAAIAAGRRCLDRDCGFAPAYPHLAQWLAEQGEVAEAVSLLVDAAARLPEDRGIRAQLVHLLKSYPHAACGLDGAAAVLAQLLRHEEVDPQELSASGWLLLASEPGLMPLLRDGNAGGADPAGLAAAFVRRPLALLLLAEALPPNRSVERMLTRLRRWLLLSGSDGGFAPLCAALAAQRARNGGAWAVDKEEWEELRRSDDLRPIVAAYPPEPRRGPEERDRPGSVAQRLREQYEAHPYPQWRRITRGPEQGFRAFVGRCRPTEPAMPGRRPRVLVAGCGTGRHAIQLALRMPDADVVAIDVSAASLSHARERARALGLATIDFRQLDLHECERLEGFDHIECGGVLHHLADPEAGWRALTRVMAEGATMRIALYSRFARRHLPAARAWAAERTKGRTDEGSLRDCRAAFLALPEHHKFAHLWGFTDFYSLAGFRDLVANVHEDPFDLPRIARALAELGFVFLRFDQIDPATLSRKAALFPPDFGDREGDLEEWAAFEEMHPDTFRSMYHFWCARNGRGQAARAAASRPVWI